MIITRELCKQEFPHLHLTLYHILFAADGLSKYAFPKEKGLEFQIFLEAYTLFWVWVWVLFNGISTLVGHLMPKRLFWISVIKVVVL